jgi:hypothetical protein
MSRLWKVTGPSQKLGASAEWTVSLGICPVRAYDRPDLGTGRADRWRWEYMIECDLRVTDSIGNDRRGSSPEIARRSKPPGTTNRRRDIPGACRTDVPGLGARRPGPVDTLPSSPSGPGRLVRGPRSCSQAGEIEEQFWALFDMRKLVWNGR